MPAAVADAAELGTTIWQLAAERGLVLEGDIRVIHPTQLVFLVGDAWVVEPAEGGGWEVRPWLANGDERYADSEDMLNPAEDKGEDD